MGGFSFAIYSKKLFIVLFNYEFGPPGRFALEFLILFSSSRDYEVYKFIFETAEVICITTSHVSILGVTFEYCVNIVIFAPDLFIFFEGEGYQFVVPHKCRISTSISNLYL